MNERGESPMNSGIARKIVKSFQQAESAAQPADKLAPHERQVLELLAQRHLYKEIADQLQLSDPTVNFCIRVFTRSCRSIRGLRPWRSFCRFGPLHSRLEKSSLLHRLSVGRDPFIARKIREKRV